MCLVDLRWSTDALRMIAASVLLYAAGMILNDHADRREDAKQRPERPIPRGEIAPGLALLLGIAGVAGCLFTSPIPRYHACMAALVLGYDYVLKGSVALGALSMGTLRGLNLLAPAAFLCDAPLSQLLLPAGLQGDVQFDVARIAAAGYALYIVAITLLGVLEDADRVRRQAVQGLVAVPPITAVLVACSLPERWPATAIAVVLAGWMFLRFRGVTWNQPTIRQAMMWLLLGTMLYTGLLALGTGRLIEALIIVAMIVPARLIAWRISLT